MNNCCEKCKTNRNEVATGEPICNNRNCPCHKPTNVNRLTDISLEEALPLIAERRVVVTSTPTPKVSEDWIWIETKGEEIVKTLSSAFLKEISSKEAAKIIRIALQEATQRGRELGIKESNSGRLMYQRGRGEVLKEASNALTKMLTEFANTPIDKRGNGWDWILKARDRVALLESIKGNG